MENELTDFLPCCRVERRLAELTCTAYEGDVRPACAFCRRRGFARRLAELTCTAYEGDVRPACALAI